MSRPDLYSLFADLGYADAETHLLKAGLANQIQEIISARGLTQSAAAKHLGISQPDISRILNASSATYPLNA